MRYFHLIFGVVMLIVFAITGRFMRIDFPDKDAIPPELRVLLRSRHIYILLSAFVHVVLGVYLRIGPESWRKFVQIGGSILLFAASLTFVFAFFHESYRAQTFSEFSRAAIYVFSFGAILHLFGGFRLNSGNER